MEPRIRRADYHASRSWPLAAAICWTCVWQAVLASEAPKPPRGRAVKVAAIAIGLGGKWEDKIQLARQHLEIAGREAVDLACLPEEFAGLEAEPIDGKTVQAISGLAAKHQMYVICPIRELAADGKQFNTAVLIRRDGSVGGYYRKVFVFWDENLHASGEGVKTFDLDFGRIALLTCFDLNFDEAWQSAERQGAEIVVWPSAYCGGRPLNGYAMIHNYHIIAVGSGDLIDFLGRPVECVTSPLEGQYVTTFDLDATIVHLDFNREKIERLQRDYAEAVACDLYPCENWCVLRSSQPSLMIRTLCREYQLESLREYRHRSRREIEQLRAQSKTISLENRAALVSGSGDHEVFEGPER